MRSHPHPPSNRRIREESSSVQRSTQGVIPKARAFTSGTRDLPCIPLLGDPSFRLKNAVLGMTPVRRRRGIPVACYTTLRWRDLHGACLDFLYGFSLSPSCCR